MKLRKKSHKLIYNFDKNKNTISFHGKFRPMNDEFHNSHQLIILNESTTV
jgi:hypothetical protein